MEATARGQSSSLHADEAAEEDCPICYETFADQKAEDSLASTTDVEAGEGCSSSAAAAAAAVNKSRFRVEGCKHEFCRECLSTHCQHAVSAREIPIRCPATPSCDNMLNDSQVQDLLCNTNHDDYGSIINNININNNNWAKFQRFQKLLEDPSLISCVRCGEVVSKELNRKNNHCNNNSNVSCDNNNVADIINNKNQLVCPSCDHCFCAIHGDAHPGKTCQDYKPPRQIRKSEKAIRRWTKPCSHCGVPIQKESGCDHIVCLSCKKDMCFRCGTHLYLRGEMVRSCQKCDQSYIDHRYIWRYRLTLCLSLPIYIPICVVHMLVMGLLAIATCGCFCCMGFGYQLEEEDESNTNSIDQKKKGSFAPLKGIRAVLALVFLPAVDLFRQCGVPCCCGLDDIPGGVEHMNSNVTEESDVDEESGGEDEV